MEFLCYHRDRSGSMPLRQALLEAHWAYMDGFAKQLIARGPTFDAAGERCTGSVHIVDLPDAATARAFAFDEPNYQAGVYRDVLLRRWRNTLGRTMWEFPGGREGGNRYLVLGFGEGEPVDLTPPPAPSEPSDRDDLIAYGPLLSDDGTTWVGTAALVRAPDAATAAAVLRTPERYADIEVHDWFFGGRPTT
ncbi:YciI family protein [Streptomyces sp. NPDC003035]|uniref:YciI family protein n=1 Tax=Streptomyces sp. NPDC003035 TaxID=3364676 RepID=UPI00368C265C